MIRFGNLTKIGFSRISILPAAAGQILPNRKFSEKIPDKNSINSIIDEIKHGINKLESEMGRSIVVEKDYKNKNAMQPHFTPIPRTIAEKVYKKPKILRLETMDYSVDFEPNQREMKIELKQDENGKKMIHISQDIGEKEEEEISKKFLKIRMSDAHNVLNAMNDLEVEWPENYAKALRQNKPKMICEYTCIGTFVFDYKFGIHFRPNKPLDFRMKTISKENGEIQSKLHGPIPIEVFYWLKLKMAELVEEYGGFDDEENQDDFDVEEED